MLYFVPTPIGNLNDISQRALEILGSCEVIICEDTRVTKSLLNLLSSKFSLNFKNKEFFSLHTHNEKEFFTTFDTTKFNQICVYVTDAGMPCISDPGAALVKFVQENNINYEVISGANSLLLAVAASGIVTKEFIFLGFLPNNGSKREQAIQNLLANKFPSVVYESPKRVLDLVELCANTAPEREIFAIKEATKKFEKKYKYSAVNLLNILKSENLKGEWTLVIDSAKQENLGIITTKDILNLDIAPKQKAKLISKITGENSKKIYENLIK